MSAKYQDIANNVRFRKTNERVSKIKEKEKAFRLRRKRVSRKMSEFTSGRECDLDLMLCVDCSGDGMKGLARNVLRNVKAWALTMIEKMFEFGFEVETARFQLVTFGAFKENGERNTQASPVFELSDRFEEIEKYARNVECTAGEETACGMEALVEALATKTPKGASCKYRFVWLITDKEAFSPSEDNEDANFSAEEELIELKSRDSTKWLFNRESRRQKLMVIAPSGTRYERLSKTIEDCLFAPFYKEDVLQESTWDELIKYFFVHFFD